MKMHLTQRTAHRLLKADALRSFDASCWPAEPGRVVFQVVAKNDPNGSAAKAAFEAAWRETFSRK